MSQHGEKFHAVCIENVFHRPSALYCSQMRWTELHSEIGRVAKSGLRWAMSWKNSFGSLVVLFSSADWRLSGTAHLVTVNILWCAFMSDHCFKDEKLVFYCTFCCTFFDVLFSCNQKQYVELVGHSSSIHVVRTKEHKKICNLRRNWSQHGRFGSLSWWQINRSIRLWTAVVSSTSVCLEIMKFLFCVHTLVVWHLGLFNE